MTEIIIVIYMGGLQRFQMRVILSGAIPFYDFMTYGINKGIEVLKAIGTGKVASLLSPWFSSQNLHKKLALNS